jgi:hypothetical protein
LVSDFVTDYSLPTQTNFSVKIQNHWVFLGDAFIAYGAIIGGLLAALLLIAVIRATTLERAGSIQS